MTSVYKKFLGEQGECAAMDYLIQRGYRIRKHHWRSRLGEIDIIAIKRRAIYFIEVKTRRSAAYGEPLAAISTWQRKRIIQSALGYLSQTGFEPEEIHFSVIGIRFSEAGPAQISFLEDAFEAEDSNGFLF